MNRINGAIAGLSFFGLLSASGYAEMGELPMRTYTVLGLLLLAVFVASVYRAVRT